MEIMIYNIDFDLCAVVISVISLFFILLKKGLQRESNRLLFYIILASLASAVFDIWSSFCVVYPGAAGIAPASFPMETLPVPLTGGFWHLSPARA